MTSRCSLPGAFRQQRADFLLSPSPMGRVILSPLSLRAHWFLPTLDSPKIYRRLGTALLLAPEEAAFVTAVITSAHFAIRPWDAFERSPLIPSPRTALPATSTPTTTPPPEAARTASWCSPAPCAVSSERATPSATTRSPGMTPSALRSSPVTSARLRTILRSLPASSAGATPTTSLPPNRPPITPRKP